MNNYVMPVKAIKKIIKRELEEMYSAAISTLYKNGHNDTIREVFHLGYEQAEASLEECQTHEDLDNFIGPLYRMSLQEWIESL